MRLPPGIPPGRYRVEASLYDGATGAGLGASGPDGAFRGTRVVASRTGEVVLVARAFPGYGVVVILRHGPSYKTFYGYLSETSLQAGDAVAKGESLGVTGIEPRSGEPRLHFRVYEGTAAVNPVKHLK